MCCICAWGCEEEQTKCRRYYLVGKKPLSKSKKEKNVNEHQLQLNLSYYHSLLLYPYPPLTRRRPRLPRRRCRERLLSQVHQLFPCQFISLCTELTFGIDHPFFCQDILHLFLPQEGEGSKDFLGRAGAAVGWLAFGGHADAEA